METSSGSGLVLTHHPQPPDPSTPPTPLTPPTPQPRNHSQPPQPAPNPEGGGGGCGSLKAPQEFQDGRRLDEVIAQFADGRLSAEHFKEAPLEILWHPGGTPVFVYSILRVAAPFFPGILLESHQNPGKTAGFEKNDGGKERGNQFLDPWPWLICCFGLVCLWMCLFFNCPDLWRRTSP